MNIFALNISPVVSAQIQHDKHVVKMVLESAQMLCSTFDPNLYDVPYKRVHYNHPCTKWARENIGNFFWLVNHGLALASEYTYRYGKVHMSEKVIKWCKKNILSTDISKHPTITPFAQAMPDEYKDKYSVLAYRKYYVGEKLHNAKWTKRPIPKLFQPYVIPTIY